MSEVVMNAVFVEKAAPDATVEMREVPIPDAGLGQVLIECHYGSLNWSDTMISRGVYPGQLAAEPYVALENIIPGADVSGRISVGIGMEKGCVYVDGVKVVDHGEVLTLKWRRRWTGKNEVPKKLRR